MAASHRLSRAKLGAVGIVAAALAAGCGSSAKSVLPPVATTASTLPSPSTTVTVTTTTTTTTTVPGATTTTTPPSNGTRTVVYPLGIDMRAGPSTSAKVLGTLVRGAEVTVNSYNPASGGWLNVKGVSVTGWISANQQLTAPGTFYPFASASGSFSTLYPTTWSATATSSGGAVLRSASGTETVSFSTGASVSALPPLPAGFQPLSSQQLLVCGVTGHLLAYTRGSTTTTSVAPQGQAVTEPYLAVIDLAIDKAHALGIQANLTSLSQISTVISIASSVTFPAKVCGA